MTFQVIGAGSGRTGTSSLRDALEILLDGPVYHMWDVIPRPEHTTIWHDAVRGEIVDFAELFAGWVGSIDWPASLFVPELAATFPDALVLLSTRDRDSWYRSAAETVFKSMGEPSDNRPAPWFAMCQDLMRVRFSLDFADEDTMKAAFDAHNAFIQETIPEDRLLVWGVGDGWEPICERLGVPVPDQPFPHVNQKQQWAEKPPDVELRER